MATPNNSACPACREELPAPDLSYCPRCGTYLLLAATEETTISSTEEKEEDRKEAPQIGPYKVLRTIGKGGMGEVLLIWDRATRRRLALKQVRPELRGRSVLYQRFLREAYLTGQLAHPGVVPIYNIHVDDELYYTMPYIQGATLKTILRETRQAKRPRRPLPVSGTIPSLIRVFMSICHIVAYVHSQGVLHRDLKPENIMVGTYGQVYILDWGLAKSLKEKELSLDLPHEGGEEEGDLTRPGKIFGTVAYMSPEIALGKPSSFASDIYALGVILYQVLCLHLPFKRSNIKTFRAQMREEVLINPAKVAPYRNVPHMLARIARKCLMPNPNHRYTQVEEILRDLEGYLEGRSDWFLLAELDVNRKEDWEFQENVYLAREMALTGAAEVTEWVSLMVSHTSLPGNTKFVARISIEEGGAGIGLLLSIPERSERVQIQSGYCLWLSSDKRAGSKLFRSGVEVLEIPEIYLKPGTWYDLRLEKVDNNLYFYLDDELRFSYISHLPLIGTHVGLLYRDANFSLEGCKVYAGSYSIKVNCLAIPDAFLAEKHYDLALAEYRRIAYSFPERDEGREAGFRAGITLLEKGKSLQEEAIFDEALTEFERLHTTPGAPFEYLGKAIVYQALGEGEEESKCLELAFRRHKHHPLLPVIKEHLVYRLHESSRTNRRSAYRLVLLLAQQVPTAWLEKGTRHLVDRLQRHWEPLPFITPLASEETREEVKRLNVAIPLAFWLARPYVLIELIDELCAHPQTAPSTLNALYSLIALGCYRLLEKELPVVAKTIPSHYSAIEPLLIAHHECLANGVQKATTLSEENFDLRTFTYLMRSALRTRQPQIVFFLLQHLPDGLELTEEQELELDAYRIWAHLLLQETTQAADLFEKYPLETLNQESSLLHFLYGCYLAATEGEELALIHLGGVLETPYPRSWSLLGHYLTDPQKQTDEWVAQAFLWEKRQLYRELALYHFCLGDEEPSRHYSHLEEREYVH